MRIKKVPKSIVPILRELKKRLRRLYGNRLKNVVLHGSYARGDFTSGSDIDVIVVLDGLRSTCQEISRCSDALGDLELEFDALISILPIDAEDFEKRELPVLLTARKEGISV
ncbi:MAG: nucleotidyltransferase domain-containing protein [Planctomycetota bacterium]